MKAGFVKCLHFESGQVYFVKENQDVKIYFAFFPCFVLSICNSNAIHGKFVSKIFQELPELSFTPVQCIGNCSSLKFVQHASDSYDWGM